MERLDERTLQYEVGEIQSLMCLRANMSIFESGISMTKEEKNNHAMVCYKTDIEAFYSKDAGSPVTGFWNRIDYNPQNYTRLSLMTHKKGSPVDGSYVWRKGQDIKTELKRMCTFWIDPNNKSGEQLEDRLLAVRKGYYKVKLQEKRKKRQKENDRRKKARSEELSVQVLDSEEEREEGSEAEEGDAISVGEPASDEEEMTQATETGAAEEEGRDGEAEGEGDVEPDEMPDHYKPSFWWCFLYKGPCAKYVNPELSPASFLVDVSSVKYRKLGKAGGRKFLREQAKTNEEDEREAQPDRGMPAKAQQELGLVRESLDLKKAEQNLMKRDQDINLYGKLMDSFPKDSPMFLHYRGLLESLVLPLPSTQTSAPSAPSTPSASQPSPAPVPASAGAPSPAPSSPAPSSAAPASPSPASPVPTSSKAPSSASATPSSGKGKGPATDPSTPLTPRRSTLHTIATRLPPASPSTEVQPTSQEPATKRARTGRK